MASKLKTKNRRKRKSSAFPDIDYDRVLPTLPFDNDGYVKSFDLILTKQCIDNNMIMNEQKLPPQMQQNKEEIQEFFAKYGLVVIRNILNKRELKLSQMETFDFIESKFDGFDRNNPKTWHTITGLSAQTGVISDYPIMSKQLCLNRVNPKLYQSFKYILNDSNLFTNIGRIGWMRPIKNVLGMAIDKPQWQTVDGKRWLHFDWSPLTNHSQTYGMSATKYHWQSEIDTYDRVRVQSILALSDCSVENGGFQCLPGFHNILAFWVHKYGKQRLESKILNHRFTFDASDNICESIVKCPIKAGDLLVWNSKLPHSNFANNSEHCRMVQYIKYASYSDTAVRPVKFGVLQKGPWDRIPLTLELPFGLDLLTDWQKSIYGIGYDNNEKEIADSNIEDKDAFSKFGIFIM